MCYSRLCQAPITNFTYIYIGLLCIFWYKIVESQKDQTSTRTNGVDSYEIYYGLGAVMVELTT